MSKIIYATARVEGLDGVYANPAGFNGELEAGATTVITNDENIAKAYKEAKVEVKDFTEAQKKVLFPKAEKKEEK